MSHNLTNEQLEQLRRDIQIEMGYTERGEECMVCKAGLSCKLHGAAEKPEVVNG